MSELTAYATGLSRGNIEAALRAAGKDPAALQPADLAAVDDFHTLGRLATAQLADLARVARDDRVLDAGTGIGGTPRFLAAEYGCSVSAVELSEEYCSTARWLNDSAGLSDRITITQGNVTDLPFADAMFDVVFSQHVQMNVADKPSLYAEAYRVLGPGGRLAIWDITGVADAYPLPWALTPAESHLAAPDDLRDHVEAAGFRVDRWTDLTEPAAQMMSAFLADEPNPLCLHVYVADFATKAANLVRGLRDGRLRAIQAVAVRPAARRGR